MTKRRIPPASSPKRKGQIPPVRERSVDVSLRFSFKLLDLHSKTKFCLDSCREGYLSKFLLRLKDLCTLTVSDFIGNRSPALKANRINFSKSSEPDGFSMLNEQLRGEDAWEFEITRNEHGRVHGLLLDETFYIVWIDPDHNLYP